MLTKAAIAKKPPREKPFKLYDGEGLYLLVNPNGSRWWRFDYTFHGRRLTISFGTYDTVSIAAARVKRFEARQQVAAGQNPSALRQDAKQQRRATGETFEFIAREWLTAQRKRLAPASMKKMEWLLEFLFPDLGGLAIRAIEPPRLLKTLRDIERPGRHDTAHRAKQLCGQIFRYAIATGRASRDPSADLRGALEPLVTTNRAAVTAPKDVAELLRAIEGFEGTRIVARALQLLPHVFVRPGELRHAEWADFDLAAGLWRIPARKMKTRREHLVPLSTQAREILKDVRAINTHNGYVFPSIRSSKVPMSENTLNAALRRLGYDQTQMTAHGFRAIAFTGLRELGWDGDVIDRQLAHVERNQVRAAYDRAQHLKTRTKMMQAWSDHLDQLRRTPPPRR